MWYTDYNALKERVDVLRKMLSDRCAELEVDETQVHNEFFKDIVVRAVHESNWQEGIELNIGKTQELADAAFDDVEQINGPHLDMQNVLRRHRDVVVKLKRAGKSEEEIATYNLARAHFAISWIFQELSRREIAAYAHVVNQLATALQAHEQEIPEEVREKVKNAFQLIEKHKQADAPVHFPLTGKQANQGELTRELLKLDFQVLLKPMKVDYIHFLHALVLMGILPVKSCGKFRKTGVHVGNPDLYFPPPTAIPKIMEAYCDNFPHLLSEQTREDPIKTAAKISHRFVAIHPYRDGNGRVSRLLMNLILTGHFPPVYLKADKKGRHRYGQAIRRADRGNIEPLAALIAMSIIEIYEKMLNSLQAH